MDERTTPTGPDPDEPLTEGSVFWSGLCPWCGQVPCLRALVRHEDGQLWPGPIVGAAVGEPHHCTERLLARAERERVNPRPIPLGQAEATLRAVELVARQVESLATSVRVLMDVYQPASEPEPAPQRRPPPPPPAPPQTALADPASPGIEI